MIIRLLLAGVLLLLAGCTTPAKAGEPASVAGTSGGLGTLLESARVVDELPVVAGYERSCSPGAGCVFGTSWSDATDAPEGRNGCDTRNDVLRAQLRDVVLKPGSNDCKVIGGTLVDPYSGATVDFAVDTSQVHIDHVFPLGIAWRAGASTWSQERRESFSNDTELELLATTAHANLSKGDSTPATWLPLKGRCDYVERYLRIATTYDLAITAADAASIGLLAPTCA